jgi:hypothetical protein
MLFQQGHHLQQAAVDIVHLQAHHRRGLRTGVEYAAVSCIYTSTGLLKHLALAFKQHPMLIR